MAERHAVLITVSGAIPDDLDEQTDAGTRPRADYRVLAARLSADVVDVPAALEVTGRIGRLLHRVGGAGVLLGWYVFRHRNDYEAVLTDGEQVGLPLALLGRLFGTGGLKHAMIAHIVSVPKKARLIRWARLANTIDRYIVYSSRQGAFLREHLNVEAHRVVLSTFMVDTEFFSPEAVDVGQRTMICSAGLERRDYATMMKAVEGLDVEVVIAAASPWSKQSDATAGVVLPANVSVSKLSLFELRDLYAASRFVVMPLVDVDFQAGITTILEAMAMGRPVVCTRTSGQTDTIVDGETGSYVAPGDVEALRNAIDLLLTDPDRIERQGSSARDWVVAHADIDVYAEGLSTIMDELLTGRVSR